MRTNNEYRTTRIWEKTLKRLRMIHALTGESIVEILDRLSEKELKGIQKDDQIGTSAESDRNAEHN